VLYEKYKKKWNIFSLNEAETTGNPNRFEELESLLDERIKYIEKNYDSPEKEIRIKEVKLIQFHISTTLLNDLTK
jgi:hypothetical protein